MATTGSFAEYVYGDETTRLRFERAQSDSGPIGYEHRRVYEEWNDDEREKLRAIARSLFDHGAWRHEGELERESCSACVLRGFVSESARLDGYKDSDGPNYAGWARVYVEAGYPIPEQWRAAFADAGDDNPAYFNALGRDLVTFGHPGWLS